MRVLVISATSAIMATAVLAAAAEHQDQVILVVDDSASRGILGEPKLFLPIIARDDQDCWPSMRFIVEDLPRPPHSLQANVPVRGMPCTYYKHDYG